MTTPAHWGKSRHIIERIVVEGKLILLTPTHLGGGNAVGPTDMTLIRDEVTGCPLLTGTSIAGALRNYLRQVAHGYTGKPGRESPVVQLFGGERGDDKGAQSLLIVDDALGQNVHLEIRDGVRIDPKTGTAHIEERDGRKQGAKFDMELLSAGTIFPLRFELLVPQGQGDVLKETLTRALQGFERGEISLGARKRRGFGRCRVEQWRIVRYDLTSADGLLAWLEESESDVQKGSNIATLLGVEPTEDDHRHRFTVKATFRLETPLLIRSEADGAEMGADNAHLRSWQNGKRVPVLPGTSLAGVLRHRALRILNTLSPDIGQQKVRELFGGQEETAEDKRKLTASRLVVHETIIEGGHNLVQARVKIDRFTGGAYPAALFSEAPLFGRPQVTVEIALRNPQDWEIGLLLLLLKDLWTGDLPIGGERSIGRGRLRGVRATLRLHRDDEQVEWTLSETDDSLQVGGDREKLERYVQALQKEVQ